MLLVLVVGQRGSVHKLAQYAYLTVNAQYYSTPHHTNCSPQPQDPCTTKYLRSFEGIESLSSIQCLLLKIDI